MTVHRFVTVAELIDGLAKMDTLMSAMFDYQKVITGYAPQDVRNRHKIALINARVELELFLNSLKGE